MVSCYADRVGRIIKGILDDGSALLLTEDQTLSQFYHNWTKTEDRMDLESEKIGAGGRNRTDMGWKPRGILRPHSPNCAPL